MLNGLSKELEKRMTSIAVRGSKLILKLMKSKEPKKMPGKFLGHGLCEHLSKSMDIPLTRNCGKVLLVRVNVIGLLLSYLSCQICWF